MSIYKLRPHHGICIQFFQGKGYNKEFVENMKNILKTLTKNPILQLTSNADCLCMSCPNRCKVNLCTSIDKINVYDEKVLQLCGLQFGEEIHWIEFSKRVQSEILSKNLREYVCGDCSWTKICN